jgi:hypothetical protein
MNLEYDKWTNVTAGTFQDGVEASAPGYKGILLYKYYAGSVVAEISVTNLTYGADTFTTLASAINASTTLRDSFNITSVTVAQEGGSGSNSDNSGLSGGAIAGIVIGVLVLVLILAYCFVRVQRSQSEENDSGYQKYNQQAGGV